MSTTEAGDTGTPGEVPAALESPAYPPLVRILAVILVVDLIGFGIWSLPALSGASWSVGSIVLFGLAAVCIAWMGY